MTPGSWRNDAACVGADIKIFYPGSGTQTSINRVAAGFCAQCPVVAECLADEDWHYEQDRQIAESVNQIYGFRAGMTQSERRERRKLLDAGLQTKRGHKPGS